jgi:hypothetical protein
MKIDISLRVLAWQLRSNAFVEAYIDVLIIVNIVCYIRLMNIFTLSKSLVPSFSFPLPYFPFDSFFYSQGTLFFIIIRLFDDVLLWSIVSIFFVIGFQIGIITLTHQVINHKQIYYFHFS